MNVRVFSVCMCGHACKNTNYMPMGVHMCTWVYVLAMRVRSLCVSAQACHHRDFLSILGCQSGVFFCASHTAIKLAR